MSRQWSYGLFLLLFGYFLFVVVNEIQTNSNFWDFKIYYHAASNDVDNVYNAKELQAEHQDKSKQLSYKYLPLTRYFFKAFRLFDYNTALSIYIGLQLLGLIAFIYLMNQQLSRGDPLLMLIFLLVFNSCFYLAFRSGNIMPILSLLVFLAMIALLKDKLVQFVVLIVIVSCFKIFPIALLGLLWFKQDQRALRFLEYGLLSFLLFVGLNMLQWQDFVHFLNAVRETTTETGIINPNTMSFSQEFGGFVLDYKLGLNNWEWAVYLIYGSIVLFVVWKVKLFLKSHNEVTLHWHLISLILLSLAIVLPRFKDYDYILLIPAAYVTIKALSLKQILVLITVWFLCSGIVVDIPVLGYILELASSYQSWLLACLLWFFCLKVRPETQF